MKTAPIVVGSLVRIPVGTKPPRPAVVLLVEPEEESPYVLATGTGTEPRDDVDFDVVVPDAKEQHALKHAGVYMPIWFPNRQIDLVHATSAQLKLVGRAPLSLKNKLLALHGMP